MRNSSKFQSKIIIRVVCAVILVIGIILVVFGLSDHMDSDLQGGTTIIDNSENETGTEDLGDVGSETESVTEDATDTEERTDTESETEGSIIVETEEAIDTEETENKDENTNTIPSDLTSLSNNSEGWGPGGDRNELNQYYCCFSYNEKYEAYDAYFTVENSNYIYLTMDEGYENGYTPAILDTLKEKNVKIVFFVTAQFVKSNPQLVQRMIDEGHTVGNHSTTHPSKGMPSLSMEAQKNDIMNLHNLIKDNYGYEMNLFRNPAGIFSEQSLAITKSLGYKSVFWSFAYYDYDPADQPEPTKALNKMVNELHPGAIYLLHAVSATNTEVLGDFIDQARTAGYEFAVLK